MVVVLEQDPECVVLVLEHVLCLDLFDESGENGRFALLTMMGRDILPIGACEEIGLEGGISDLLLIRKVLYLKSHSTVGIFRPT